MGSVSMRSKARCATSGIEWRMPSIVMTDDGVRFDAGSLARGPLGGAETAFASLALAFARRGHRVTVRNNSVHPSTMEGVDWAPLASGLPEEADLYIANRSHRLIDLLPT